MKAIFNHFTYITLFMLAITTTSCNKDVVGCTDQNSATYNPKATIDAGNCVYSGCTDPTSENYNPKANKDNGNCQYKGCTDPESVTYDPKATIDDGSCQYNGCTDPSSLNYDRKATIDDGSCQYERDAFIGTYKATEECDSGNNYQWTMEILPETVYTNKRQVRLRNLGDFGENIQGIVDENNIEVFYYINYMHLEGEGKLIGNRLELDYHVEIEIIGYVDNCKVVAIKQ